MSSSSSPSLPSSVVVHGQPPEGLECLVTMEDITMANYVEYQCHPSGVWRPAQMEQSVVQELQRTQFATYMERVKTTDCQAELKRLLSSGPPVYVSDPLGLPLGHTSEGTTNIAGGDSIAAEAVVDSGNTHIMKLWFASDNQERSAKLDGAVEGLERQQLWDNLRQFVVVEGATAGDDDEPDESVTATH